MSVSPEAPGTSPWAVGSHTALLGGGIRQDTTVTGLQGPALSSHLCPLLCVRLRSEVQGPSRGEESQSEAPMQQSTGETGQIPGQVAKPTYSRDRILGWL